MTKYATLGLSWLFSLFFSLLLVSLILTGNWLQAIPVLGLVLLLLPPAWSLEQRLAGISLSWWPRVVAIVLLLAAFIWFGSLNETNSIYKSPQVETRLMEIYDARLADWPVPYESLFVETDYGTVHVIASGPDEAPPLLLLHASGVAGWSWLSNIEALSQDYRTYAIDTLGDAGKSVLADVEHYPQSGRAQSELYSRILDKLGVERAYVVGASEGGFIGSNLALYAPDRVEKLVLLGPMGYTGTVESVLRIVVAQLFPLRFIQESTFRWAFGDNPILEAEFGEWFRLLMSGVFPRKAAPLPPFTAEQRQSLDAPVLLVLGAEDNLVGDPEATRTLVGDIPDIRVEVLPTGHLIGVEEPERVNALILKFFETGE